MVELVSSLSRRRALILGAGAALATTTGLSACGAKGVPFRVGFQKNGVLLVAKERGLTEAALKPALDKAGGGTLAWSEFASGPPLLEALSVGSLDFGATGDTPPVVAQAAGSDLMYVAAVPLSGAAAAVLVPKASPLTQPTQLKGKKVAFTKGSSAETFAAAILATQGLSLSDITPVNLSPADGGAALAGGDIDAWIIWDPYFALAEQAGTARVLASGRGITRSYQFFLARRQFVMDQPGIVEAMIAHLTDTGLWAKAHNEEVAALMSRATGVDIAVQRRVAERQDYAVQPLDAQILSDQQALADRLVKSGVAPKAVTISTAVWRGPKA